MVSAGAGWVTAPASAASRPDPRGQAWQLNDRIPTKLVIPQARPNLVARPALFARLDEGRTRKLTLISTPAGFGKTTLLSAWIAGGQVPAAWVSLDARDNDPLRFATYLIAAPEALELGLAAGCWRPCAASAMRPRLAKAGAGSADCAVLAGV